MTKPFDILAEPLARAELWSIGSDQHVLLVSLHHSITDGASVALMQRELAEAYAAALQGGQPGWAPLPVQLADYAAWQREHFAGAAMDAQLAFWKQALAGAPPLLELPTDRPRPEVFSHAGAEHRFSMPAATRAGLQQLASAHQTTPFVVALTALQVGFLDPVVAD